MINTSKLKGIIAEREKTQSDVAIAIGIDPNTFYRKMKRGVFNSDEMQAMVDYLEIEKPGEVFFA